MKNILWIIGLVALVLVANWAYQTWRMPVEEAAETQAVQVYFSVPTPTDIDFVAVEREVALPETAEVEDVLLAALKQWVIGPTFDEAEQGLGNSLNEGTQVNSVQVDDGVVTIDFNDVFDTPMGGSARVMAIRQQIERIVSQFEELKDSEIKLTVGGGQREAVLEP